MGLFGGIKKLGKKLGRGLLAGATLGGSEAVRSVVKNKQKKNADKNARIDASMDTMRGEDAAALRKLLADQPQRKSLLDSSSVAALKGEAYGTGPLAEFTAMRDQARVANEQGIQRIGNQLTDELGNQSIAGAGARMNAYSQLAQEGGLSSGARERIAQGGASSQMAQAQAARMANQRALQDQAAEFDKGNLGLTAQEATTRRGLQDKFMGVESSDVSNANQFEQDKYGKRSELEAGLLKSRREAETARLLK